MSIELQRYYTQDEHPHTIGHGVEMPLCGELITHEIWEYGVESMGLEALVKIHHYKGRKQVAMIPLDLWMIVAARLSGGLIHHANDYRWTSCEITHLKKMWVVRAWKFGGMPDLDDPDDVLAIRRTEQIIEIPEQDFDHLVNYCYRALEWVVLKGEDNEYLEKKLPILEWSKELYDCFYEGKPYAYHGPTAIGYEAPK